MFFLDVMLIECGSSNTILSGLKMRRKGVTRRMIGISLNIGSKSKKKTWQQKNCASQTSISKVVHHREMRKVAEEDKGIRC